LRWVVEHEGNICVPTPVLVECTTGDGARDAEVNRVLGVLDRAAAVLDAPDELTARRAGKTGRDERRAAAAKLSTERTKANKPTR
jgi:hypothetical protein